MEEKIHEEIINPEKKSNNLKYSVIATAIILVVMGGTGIAWNYLQESNPIEQVKTNVIFTPILDNQTEQGRQEDIELIPEPLRQKYFRDQWGIHRENFIEQGAIHLGVTEQKLLSMFDLSSDKEIWSELPLVPEDFGEINYLMQNGKFFALETLTENYWKQPEFYPSWKNCPKYWTEPDPRYWTPNGYGSYISNQFTIVSKGEEFYAVVYVHSGCGVQTWQGTRLEVSNNARDYFNLSITPNEFLLEPMFPQVSYEWVKRIEIKGNIKESTPEGVYEILIDVFPPTQQKANEWSEKYKTMYFNASQGVRPARALISLEVTVQ